MKSKKSDVSIIKAEDLTLAYNQGKNVIIKNASFEIKRGEFVFITGPSGSGKSTLLKSLYGKLRPYSGLLEVNKQNMRSIKKNDLLKLRRNLGIIFQDYKLINEWTVEKNVALPLIIAGYSPDIQAVQAEKFLKHVGLSEHKKKYPLELSGGEQQRVGVARALAKRPFLILADEPTGNLDDFSSNIVWDLLEDACLSLNATVLVVTHKMPSFLGIQRSRQFSIENGVINEL